MNKRTTCLLRRLLISQQVGQIELIKMMEATNHTDAEIAEVFNNHPTGEKLYVLHGYWVTTDLDGVKIVKMAYEPEMVLKMLDGIVENKAAGYLELHGELKEKRGSRYYEVTDGSGGYAKFYITEEVVEYE